MTQLQPSIEETENTGQLYAVSPLAVAATAEGDSETSPPHDVPVTSDDREDNIGQ